MQRKMELMQEQMAYLQGENEKLNSEKMKRQREEWDKLRPLATEIFYKKVNKIFPNMVCKVTLEHVDASGFWFTFELQNDSRRQTYAIRHEELEVSL